MVNITESAGSGMAFAGYKRDRLSTASGFLVYYETSKRNLQVLQAILIIASLLLLASYLAD